MGNSCNVDVKAVTALQDLKIIREHNNGRYAIIGGPNLLENIKEFDKKNALYTQIAQQKYGVTNKGMMFNRNFEEYKFKQETYKSQNMKNKGVTGVQVVTVNQPFMEEFQQKYDEYKAIGTVIQASMNFESRENEQQEFKYNEPIGDNYVELVNWKRQQLKEIQEKIHNQRVLTRGAKDNAVNNKTLKELEAIEQKLENQLDMLNQHKVDYMFHAILEDLKDIEDALKSDDLYNYTEVNNRLKFYKDFEAKIENYEEYKEISSKISSLLRSEDNLKKDKLLKKISQNEAIQNSLKELNKDNTLKKTFGKSLDEEASKQAGEDVYSDFTVDDLLVAVSDISMFDKNFLGIISSTTGDTILPQYLMKEFRETLYKKQQQVRAMVDELHSFTNRTGIKDREFLFSKDEDGNKDGYLVDVFSKEWFKQFKVLKSRFEVFKKSDEASKRANYNNVKSWFNRNTHIIDFTRLQVVKDLYGLNPEYTRYFTHSDASMKAYEENLKKQLGPRYTTIIETLLNKLEKFETFKGEDTSNPFHNKNVAQRNIWELNRLWKENSSSPIAFTYTNSEGKEEVSSEYFNRFYDIPILPKSTIIDETTQEEVDSGYYNKDFDVIKNNSDYSELWDIFRRMSEHINATYNLEQFDRISYPKVEAQYAERILEGWQKVKNGGNKWKTFKEIFHGTMHDWKEMFYEQGYNNTEEGVRSNYIDTSERKIQELAWAYQMKGHNPSEAYKMAKKEVLPRYSTDLDKIFEATLLEAALHDTRLQLEDTAKALLDVHSKIKTKDNKDRERSIKRLEYYIEKVILNHTTKERGTTHTTGKNLSDNSWVAKILEYLQKTPVINKILKKQSLRLLSDDEKELLKHFEDLKGEDFHQNNIRIIDKGYNLQAKTVEIEGEEVTAYSYNGNIVDYETFNNAYKEYIQVKLKETGLDLNIAGLIDGILKTIILKGLAINPISGIFNRIEGMNTIMIMDLTGEYWTSGNADIAKEMMAFANLSKMSNKFVKGDKNRNRKEQIRIFEQLLSKLDVFQNKQDELQKSTETSKDLKGFLMRWAVTDPEFKNQGSVILSVLMDAKIKDNEGNEHPLLNKETQEFTPFKLENGVLVIKEEFSNSLDFASEDMAKLVTKIEAAVSHSQGNYNNYDIMAIKKEWYGRALTLFKTWMPEHIRQRWGFSGKDGELNIDLFNEKHVRAGRFIEGYKGSKGSFATFMLSALGISYAGFGFMGLFGAGAISAFVYTKFLKKVSSEDSIKRDTHAIKEISQFLHSTIMESLNYPSRLLSSVPGVNKMRFNTTEDNWKNAYRDTNMTEQEVQSLRAMSRELAIMLTFLALKLMIGALTYDDDDDKNSPQRMRYNFIQNQLSRSITTLNSWADPGALVNDNQKIGALSFLQDLFHTIDYIAINPDMEKAEKSFFNITPVPRLVAKMVQDKMPWEDSMNYDELQDGNKVPTLKWTSDAIKNFDTKGEYTANKKYLELRKEKREELQDKYIGMVNGNKEQLKIIVDGLMKEQLGDKPKGATSKETIKYYKENGSLDTKNQHENIRKKLKKANVSDEDIERYMNNLE